MIFKRLTVVGTLAGLCLILWPTPAGAATRTPQQAEFHRAVVTCEQRTAPTALRGCVRGLVAPDLSQPAILDLWRVFNDCLSFADAAVMDTMYPPTDEDYEDAVNACLGL
jgi:hypothetical protein